VPTYLLHGSEHLLSTPFWEAPIIVILLNSTNTDRAVAAAAATDETSTRYVARSPIQTRLRRSYNIPVRLALVIHGPSTSLQLFSGWSISQGNSRTMCMLSISSAPKRLAIIICLIYQTHCYPVRPPASRSSDRTVPTTVQPALVHKCRR
jgi:hypothetical protein